MFKVIKNVKMPPKAAARTGPRRKYPLDTLGVGEMFFVPNGERATRKSLATHVSMEARKLGRKFSTRTIHMRETAPGEWVVCDPQADNAVEGVGVWRTA